MLVWVLAPFVATADPALDYYNDYSQSQAEFARAFDALGTAWRWQPVAMHDFREVIDTIASETTTHVPVVFNLCDGDETNGVPGISVIRYLDEVGLPYTGADQHFYHVTTESTVMPMLPAEMAGLTISGVPRRLKTPPNAVVPRGLTSHGAVGTPATSKACFMSIFDVVTW